MGACAKGTRGSLQHQWDQHHLVDRHNISAGTKPRNNYHSYRIFRVQKMASIKILCEEIFRHWPSLICLKYFCTKV